MYMYYIMHYTKLLFCRDFTYNNLNFNTYIIQCTCNTDTHYLYYYYYYYILCIPSPIKKKMPWSGRWSVLCLQTGEGGCASFHPCICTASLLDKWGEIILLLLCWLVGNKWVVLTIPANTRVALEGEKQQHRGRDSHTRTLGSKVTQLMNIQQHSNICKHYHI